VKPARILAAWRGQPECENCGVRHLALFADLDEADFKGLHLPIEDLGFESGAALYHAGDPGSAVFTVRSGVVKLVQYLPNGGQRIVRLLTQGSTAGLEALLDHPYQHSAIAMQASLVCRIPCGIVQKLNARNPKLYDQLMQRWHRSLQQADEWITLLSTGSARARMARLFLYLKGDSCDPVCQFFGREEVAAILGVTTETASRTVAELKRAQVISPLPSNRFRCDVAKLQEIALN
jgi:CRP/FNR family transcriptional regulator, anaerobic regulatory protein